MIHLSSYHSNGLPPVVWSNKVNLIGEKVYKPKIHFCESCNKPILIYGRLIPCKHVFCFTCASLCLPPAGGQLNGDSSPPSIHHHNHQSSTTTSNNTTNTASCHRCRGRTLRVERNSLNSIFVCQIDSCKRTYLSARDLQAHVTHRHSKSKSTSNNTNNQATNSSACQAAISSSPYISSSTLLHMNGHNHHQHQSGSNRHRQTSSSSTTNAPYSPASNHAKHADSGSPAGSSSRGVDVRNRRDRESHHHHHNHHPPLNHHKPGSGIGSGRNRDRPSNRDRGADDNIKRDRDNKEYLKQSLQRAAQWAEASAQTLEKGLTSR